MALLRTFRPPTVKQWEGWGIPEREDFLAYLVEHPRLFEYLGTALTPHVTAYVRVRPNLLRGNAIRQAQAVHEAYPRDRSMNTQALRRRVPARTGTPPKLSYLEQSQLADIRKHRRWSYKRVGAVFGVSETLAIKICRRFNVS